jgi:hypothetical protein
LHGRRCAEPDWSPKAPAESGADIAKNGVATQRSKMPGFVEFFRAQRADPQEKCGEDAARAPAHQLVAGLTFGRVVVEGVLGCPTCIFRTSLSISRQVSHST